MIMIIMKIILSNKIYKKGKNDMLKNENYLIIYGWMVNELNLKGNDLLVYAIIYGFCQDNQNYDGSKQYLVEWTNSTKQGVCKNLKPLMERGLISRIDGDSDSLNFSSYRVNKVYDTGNKVTKIDNKVYENSKQSLPNNNIYNTNNINKINFINNIYCRVIEYLNNRTGANYRPSSAKTQSLIRARLKEKYTLDDFKTVIDKKCVEWMNTDMQKYLRPETLFGTKFESYLNQPIKSKKFNNSFMEVLRGMNDE